jgi:hypothetical protein
MIENSINKFGSKTSGLGDILLLTSICKYKPMQYTIQLPEKQKRFSILFEGLANVEITENIITLKDIGGGHYATRKMRDIYGTKAELLDNKPLVLYSDHESEEWADKFIKENSKDKIPVILQPNCSKQWSHVRALPPEVKSNIKSQLSSQGAYVIDLSENEQLDLRKYICLLRKVGLYFGTNTGDFHLAVAVGAVCHIYEPKNNQFFQDYEWNYNHPSISYNKL